MLVAFWIIFDLLCVEPIPKPSFSGRLEYRIQNGFTANIGEFPSTILLTGNTHRCTGTLITPSKIITAGHCACGDPMTKAYANLTSIDEIRGNSTQQRNVVGWSYPDEYTTPCNTLGFHSDANPELLGGASDMAILTTDEPFDMSYGLVEVAHLPNINSSQILFGGKQSVQGISGESAIVTGFGRESRSKSTGKLRFGFINLRDCPGDIFIDTIDALCSKVNDNFQIPDIGDSGGPLINHNGELIGITSISGSGWIVFSSVFTHNEFINDELAK